MEDGLFNFGQGLQRIDPNSSRLLHHTFLNSISTTDDFPYTDGSSSPKAAQARSGAHARCACTLDD